MRIAHITDIHVTRLPKLWQLTPKRMLGAANLVIGGRRHHFSTKVQQALVDAVEALEPDAVICTGDLTQTSLPEEFIGARELLAPLFQKRRGVLIPGNHDTYTQAAWRGRHMEDHFGEFLGEGDWPRVHHLSEDLAVIGVDTCRAHVLSSGRVDPGELTRLDTLLGRGTLDGVGLIIAIHYPLRDRRGEPYGPPSRALSNAAALEKILARHASKIRAILHGHEHHGYRTTLGQGEDAIPILNPGSSGYAWLPKKRRTAHFNVYTFDASSLEVERFAYCGEQQRFIAEEGGPYASGG
jgi:3',5'-cyclic AMP phosphodiesterase CpdA